MNKEDLRTLRAQLLLVIVMFVGCAGTASLIASQRAFFESRIREKYAVLPASLQSVAAAAATGRIDQEVFDKLTEAQRLALYDDWLARTDSPSGSAPAGLVAAWPDGYLRRAERTLVCGRIDQKMRALDFLGRSGSMDAIKILRKVKLWASHRQMSDFAAGIGETIDRLQSAAKPAPARTSETSGPVDKGTNEPGFPNGSARGGMMDSVHAPDSVAFGQSGRSTQRVIDRNEHFVVNSKADMGSEITERGSRATRVLRRREQR